jgi:hypothetical protein
MNKGGQAVRKPMIRKPDLKADPKLPKGCTGELVVVG